MTRAPIKRHGGKAYLAKWIAGLLPPHDNYIEPFCGSAAVLFAKEPSDFEIIGDLDESVVCVMREIRDDGDWFADALRREAYIERNFIEWRNLAPGELIPLGKAMRQFIVSNMSRGGLGETFAWSDRLRGGRPGDENAWLTKLEMIAFWSDRLRHVRIVHFDAIEAIYEAKPGPGTLIYADPPYLHATRTVKSAYTHEMTDVQHAELLDLLDAHAGPVALSGYANPMYDDRLKHWARHEKPMPNHSSQSKTKQRRTEVLWIKDAR